MRIFLIFILTIISSAGEIFSASAEKPNILFIAVDDMNDWTTLFDKDNPIKTPNLERLAERGVFFTNAYCSSPACNPSRVSVMTGLQPSTSGIYDNRDVRWREKLTDVFTMQQWFMRNGYRSEGAGKIFHHVKAEAHDSASFHEFRPMGGGEHPKERLNDLKWFTINGKSRDIGHSWDWGVFDEPTNDDLTVAWATGKMRQKREQPVFLSVGIFRPHLPFYAPQRFFDLYPPEAVVPPPFPADDLRDVGDIGQLMRRWEGYFYDAVLSLPDESNASLKSMVRAYQAGASYSDEKIGELLDALDTSPMRDNTIIVLWSDHGYHLGDKGSLVKFTLWEKANHVPMIIVAPGMAKGVRCHRPVSLVDIYPTLAELAGLPDNPEVDGTSLVPLLRNPEADWQHAVLMTYMYGNHAIRSQRWRYIRYADGFEELYDSLYDPMEFHNLAGDPDHVMILEKHRSELPAYEEPPFSGRKNLMDDLLLADFSGSDFGDWESHGDAFGSGPALFSPDDEPKMVCANSGISGNAKTGVLISPPFKIERLYLGFRLSGGNYPGQICVNLYVNNRLVQTASPAHAGRFEQHLLDVKEYLGQFATIEVVDRRKGKDGFICIDRITQLASRL